MEPQERLSRIRDFLPRIENWAVCDIFCGSLKDADRYPELYWEFLQPYFQSRQPYELRFAVVMLLSHFVKKEYLEQSYHLLDRVRHEDYYVRMGVAWAVSIYFVRYPEETLAYLRDSRLDDWTYNKALQKITESYRVSPEGKAQIRAMKRRVRKEGEGGKAGMTAEILQGIFIPFLGTSLGAAMVFFMRNSLHPMVHRALTGFAAGVMVAASIWSLLIPAHGPGGGYGKLGPSCQQRPASGSAFSSCCFSIM